jgi:hypothetical protein
MNRNIFLLITATATTLSFASQSSDKEKLEQTQAQNEQDKLNLQKLQNDNKKKVQEKTKNLMKKRDEELQRKVKEQKLQELKVREEELKRKSQDVNKTVDNKNQKQNNDRRNFVGSFGNRDGSGGGSLNQKQPTPGSTKNFNEMSDEEKRAQMQAQLEQDKLNLQKLQNSDNQKIITSEGRNDSNGRSGDKPLNKSGEQLRGDKWWHEEREKIYQQRIKEYKESQKGETTTDEGAPLD